MTLMILLVLSIWVMYQQIMEILELVFGLQTVLLESIWDLLDSQHMINTLPQMRLLIILLQIILLVFVVLWTR